MTGTWETAMAVIQDRTGLHARPAVKLTKLAKRFDARVEVRAQGHDAWVNAKSPSAVMKIRAPHLSVLEIRAAGGDARLAVEAMRDLVDRDFDDVAAQ